MGPDELALEPRDGGVAFAVRAHPGARRNAVTGVRQGALCVAVTAAPERGKANRAIVKLLAEKLGVRPSAIEVTSGVASTEKRLLVAGAEVETLRAAFAALLTGAG